MHRLHDTNIFQKTTPALHCKRAPPPVILSNCPKVQSQTKIINLVFAVFPFRMQRVKAKTGWLGHIILIPIVYLGQLSNPRSATLKTSMLTMALHTTGYLKNWLIVLNIIINIKLMIISLQMKGMENIFINCKLYKN